MPLLMDGFEERHSFTPVLNPFRILDNLKSIDPRSLAPTILSRLEWLSQPCAGYLVHPPGFEREKRIIMLFYPRNFLGAA